MYGVGSWARRRSSSAQSSSTVGARAGLELLVQPYAVLSRCVNEEQFGFELRFFAACLCDGVAALRRASRSIIFVAFGRGSSLAASRC